MQKNAQNAESRFLFLVSLPRSGRFFLFFRCKAPPLAANMMLSTFAPDTLRLPFLKFPSFCIFSDKLPYFSLLQGECCML